MQDFTLLLTCVDSLSKFSIKFYSKDHGTRNLETFILVLVLQAHIQLCEVYLSEWDALASFMYTFQGDTTG